MNHLERLALSKGSGGVVELDKPAQVVDHAPEQGLRTLGVVTPGRQALAPAAFHDGHHLPRTTVERDMNRAGFAGGSHS